MLAGLVVASVFYSLPFAVQPLQTAFMSVGPATLEAARTLGSDRHFFLAGRDELLGEIDKAIRATPPKAAKTS